MFSWDVNTGVGEPVVAHELPGSFGAVSMIVGISRDIRTASGVARRRAPVGEGLVEALVLITRCSVAGYGPLVQRSTISAILTTKVPGRGAAAPDRSS